MWYRYATIDGIKDFTKKPKKEVKKQSDLKSVNLLPPLHDNCRCKIVKKNNLYQWLVEVEPCNQCLEAQARFNLEQKELAKMKPIIEPNPEMSVIEPINDAGINEPIENEEIEAINPEPQEIDQPDFIEQPINDLNIEPEIEPDVIEELEEPEEEIIKPLRRRWRDFRV